MKKIPDPFAQASKPVPGLPRQWDARLARRLVTPLRSTRVTPNHLTSIRLATGLAGALAFAHGGYLWGNIGALLVVLSNFLDHTDGELARISGKSSRLGHVYDLLADALVTVALFVGIGLGLASTTSSWLPAPLGAPALGMLAGAAIALIFFLRMRIEALAGKAGAQQAHFGGFESEDVLYLIPLVTLANGTLPFLLAAALGAPLYAAWSAFEYWRVTRRAVPRGTTPNYPAAQ
jgi:phosphatidylglycerophosphate synthase